MMKRFFTFLLLAVAAMFSATATAHGDVNGDGEVNIADINSAIGIILDDLDYTPAIDVNNDGEINIADVNALIDIVLDNATTTPDDSEWVDLGLPSGTLWATRNVGASTPEDYGDYFAWGETEPKDLYGIGLRGIYKWYVYDLFTGGYGYTKYCTRSSYGYNGFVDDKTELDPEDDAAYVNWGPSWRMPTTEQQQELINECTWQLTQRDGVNGFLVIGSNENSLFLPASGFRLDESLYFAGSVGYYWSRTLYSNRPSDALYLIFYSEAVGRGFHGRESGSAVRAVRIP